MGISANGASPASECLRSGRDAAIGAISRKRITRTVDVVIADGKSINTAGVIAITNASAHAAVVTEIVITAEYPGMTTCFDKSEADPGGVEPGPTDQIPCVVVVGCRSSPHCLIPVIRIDWAATAKNVVTEYAIRKSRGLGAKSLNGNSL